MGGDAGAGAAGPVHHQPRQVQRGRGCGMPGRGAPLFHSSRLPTAAAFPGPRRRGRPPNPSRRARPPKRQRTPLRRPARVRQKTGAPLKHPQTPPKPLTKAPQSINNNLPTPPAWTSWPTRCWPRARPQQWRTPWTRCVGRGVKGRVAGGKEVWGGRGRPRLPSARLRVTGRRQERRARPHKPSRRGRPPGPPRALASRTQPQPRPPWPPAPQTSQVEDFVGIADALLVNISNLSSDWNAAKKLAAQRVRVRARGGGGGWALRRCCGCGGGGWPCGCGGARCLVPFTPPLSPAPVEKAALTPPPPRRPRPAPRSKREGRRPGQAVGARSSGVRRHALPHGGVPPNAAAAPLGRPRQRQ